MKCISAFLSLCLIAAFVVAQPNYDFSKLKRVHLGRGVIAIRESIYCCRVLALSVLRLDGRIF